MNVRNVDDEGVVINVNRKVFEVRQFAPLPVLWERGRG